MATKKINSELRVLCPQCNIETKHKIVHEHGRIYGNNSDKEHGTRWSIEWQIIECLGCETISGRELLSFEDDVFYDDEGKQVENINLYPIRSNSRLQIQTFANLPHSLVPIYREVIDSFNNRTFILCAGGLRALIEGICNDKQIKGGKTEITKKDGTIKSILNKDLQGKILGLYQMGFLTKSNSEALHGHRFLGNKSLHELQIPSYHKLKLAIEIIELTIKNIYEMEELGERLKNNITHWSELL
jgi:hypothetical protein